MMSPTLHGCRQLEGIDPAALLKPPWNRRIPTVAPRVVEVDGRPFLDTPPAEEL
jgi:hypothetical protein